MGDEGHNDPSCDWSAETNKKRAWRDTPNKSRVTSRLVNYRRLDCSEHLASYKRHFLSSRLDFYLILALGPRNGLGYCVVNGHKVIGNRITNNKLDPHDNIKFGIEPQVTKFCERLAQKWKTFYKSSKRIPRETNVKKNGATAMRLYVLMRVLAQELKQ